MLIDLRIRAIECASNAMSRCVGKLRGDMPRVRVSVRAMSPETGHEWSTDVWIRRAGMAGRAWGFLMQMAAVRTAALSRLCAVAVQVVWQARLLCARSSDVLHVRDTDEQV
jgi:hypothetical protein